ncbi:MAG: lysophospholipid acyltransferase family protein [Burkholderiales bacterium]
MITAASKLVQWLRTARRRWWPAPPLLAAQYTLADYGRFMREETFLYSPRYARRLVVPHGEVHLLAAARAGGCMVCFVHYGSWILAGGAIAHRLGLPYTVIASRRNLENLAPEEKGFWEGVHRRSRALYGHRLFYTDQSPRQALRWLKTPGHVLGVVLDVREENRKYDEKAFRFLGHELFMQTGPARLACIAGVPMIPATIRYLPEERRHHLYFDAAVLPDGRPEDMTQRALLAIERHVAAAPQQQFYDIVAAFSRPAP